MPKKLFGLASKFSSQKQRSILIVFIIIFGLVGIALLLSSNAATPSAGFEAESGSLGCGATKVSGDSTASGSSYVKFGTCTTTAPPPPSGDTWGNHMGISMWADKTNIDKAKALGVKWVRFGWEMNWGAFDDSIISYAHNQGMHILWGCQKTPHSYTSSDISAFATYCASWIDHGINNTYDAIEIGNEWNHEPFWNGVNGDYTLQAQITDATTAAIRAKAPNIPIMNSGWSSESSPNLPQEAMGKLLDKSNGTFKAQASVIADHPYAYNCDSPLLCAYPSRKDWNSFLATQDVWGQAAIRGFNKPVWMTEIGGPSGNGTNLYTNQPFTLASQKQLYLDYITGVKTMRASPTFIPIDKIFWHTIQDGQSSTNSTEETFGLYDANWNLKPAGQVVKDQAAQQW